MGHASIINNIDRKCILLIICCLMETDEKGAPNDAQKPEKGGPKIGSWMFWSGWNRRQQVQNAVLALILAAVVAAIALPSGAPRGEDKAKDDSLPVSVAPFADLNAAAEVAVSGYLEGDSAALVARTGGRVTSVRAAVGHSVTRGFRIAAIDADGAPNPLASQIAGIDRSLQNLGAVKEQALKSADLAVKIAETNYSAAKNGAAISAATTSNNVAIAEKAVSAAEEQLKAAEDQGLSDQAIAVARIGVESAKLARDQAELAEKSGGVQTGAAAQIALANLNIAKSARVRAEAEISAQSISLETQRSVAAAQFAQSQIDAPISGSVASLSIKAGDFLKPGQTVGEISGGGAGRIVLRVSEAVAGRVKTGQKIAIFDAQKEFVGIVSAVSAASASSGIRQVDIAVAKDAAAGRLNRTVKVVFPAADGTASDNLIPLSVLSVRTRGSFVYVAENGLAKEVPVNILGYSDNYAETDLRLPQGALVVVKGNRTLTDGRKIRIVDGG